MLKICCFFYKSRGNLFWLQIRYFSEYQFSFLKIICWLGMISQLFLPPEITQNFSFYGSTILKQTNPSLANWWRNLVWIQPKIWLSPRKVPWFHKSQISIAHSDNRSFGYMNNFSFLWRNYSNSLYLWKNASRQSQSRIIIHTDWSVWILL